jgi:ferredoxin/flavodoxin---NADP+ reductase
MTAKSVAIVGAGPSGFFTAGELFKRFPGVAVFMYEKREQPHGLVRYGVAPDHVVTKRAVKTFEQIAAQPGFHYLGGVEVGRDLSIADLRTRHDAVVICTGAEQAKLPQIPGVDLPGVTSGLAFARWNNGEERFFDAASLAGLREVVIIGNGNVALDVARMLARREEDWEGTAIAPYARAALAGTQLSRITIAGRRGPAEASFTEMELEEVLNLPDWRIEAEEGLPLGMKAPASDANKTIAFKFHAPPREVLGNDRVEAVRFDAGTVPAQLVIFATGQRGEPVPGLPFDEERHIIPNDRGRVMGMERVYVCGWIKRSPRGLIGHNRKDAIETVGRMGEDDG